MSGVVVGLYAIATFALWFVSRPYRDLRWKRACLSALTAAGLALIANQLIADIWARPRPYVTHGALTHLLAAPSPDPSFPSDHAAAAFAIAFSVLAFSRWAGVAFLFVATLIGLDRIALGLHYPSDVLAGLVVGCAAALVVTHLGRQWIDRAVALLSRVSDPLTRPVWDQVTRLVPSRR